MNVLQVLHFPSRIAAHRSLLLDMKGKSQVVIRCFSQVYHIKKGRVFIKKPRSPRKIIGGILKRELDVKPTQLYHFYKLGATQVLDKDSVMNRLSNLRIMGFTDKDITSELALLLVTPEELIRQTETLQECGVDNITPKLLVQCEVVSKKRVGLLKAAGMIPPELNVPENILAYAAKNIPPLNFDSLRVAQNLSATTPDTLALLDLHECTILHFMAWYFEDWEILKVKRRLKPRSLRRTIRALDALKSIGMQKEELKQFLFNLHCEPDNLYNVLSVYPTLGEQDMKDIIRKHPKVAMCTLADIEAALQCIKEYGLGEEAVAGNPDVLAFRLDVLRQGLSLLKSVPDLWALRHNHDILRLLSQKELFPKLQYFKSLDREIVPTVSLLRSNDVEITKVLQREHSRRHVTEFLTFLEKELKCDRAKIKEQLSRHLAWRHGSTAVMSETLSFLRSEGFKDHDIIHNVQILLYPRSYVEALLKKRVTAKVPSKTDLALCLYDLEKEHAFTGAGVFKQVEAETCREKGCERNCSTNPLCALRLRVEPKASGRGKERVCTDESKDVSVE